MSSDSTTILFGLPGVRVLDVQRVVGGGRLVQVVTDDPAAAACPVCGVFSTVVRQRRTTRPRDLPYGEERLAVRWHKRQYACREATCPRRAFTEQIPELPAGARLTGRLRRHVARLVAAGAAVSASCAGLMSWPIGHAAFVAHADAQLAEPAPVRVLGIDETRRGRPVWRQREDGRWRLTERFETNFVDLAGSGGLLGQTAGRTKTAVVAWLDARGEEWKAHVQVVAMDPCASYRAAVQDALPHATIVADHFHLVRLANQTVTDVRRRVTGTPTAAAAARPTQRGRRAGGCCAAGNACPPSNFGGCGTTSSTVTRRRRSSSPGSPKKSCGHCLRDRPPRWAATRRRTPDAPLLRLVRPHRHPGSTPARRHDRGLVARGARFLDDERDQRRHRGHEPDREDRGPHRLRLPQPRHQRRRVRYACTRQQRRVSTAA